MLSKPATLVTRLSISPDAKENFSKWQALLHETIVTHPGFVSLEILSPAQTAETDWVVVQRFNSAENLKQWRASSDLRKLLEDLKLLFTAGVADPIKETEPEFFQHVGGVTEVFITKVEEEQVDGYHDWMGKIHEAESKFPGFQKVFVQAPEEPSKGSWITILQFDTQENLDRWLSSKERQEVLSKGLSLMKSLESHRVGSSFASWFREDAVKGNIPPLWKQTMLILLVLFPLVMLEFKYLNPWTAPLNISLGTFIGNAVSVSLVSWPMMPLAIRSLRWWLHPSSTNRMKTELLGIGTVLFLYILEIAFFWHFLDK